MKIKVVTIVFTILLCVFGYTIFKDYSHDREEMRKSLESTNQRLHELQNEKDRVEKELMEAEDALDAAIGSETDHVRDSRVILFTAPNNMVYEEIFPLMKKSNLKGIVVLRNNLHLGQQNCLSQEYFSEMEKNGWVCAVGPGNTIVLTGSEQDLSVLENYITAYQTEMNNEVKAVYFDKDQYAEIYDDVLKKLGIETIYYEGSIVEFGSGDLNRVHVIDYLSNLALTGNSTGAACTGLRVTVDWIDQTPETARYSIDIYEDFLKKCQEQKDEGELIFPNVKNIKKDLEKEALRVASYEASVEILEEERTELEEQLDRIENELQVINHG